MKRYLLALVLFSIILAVIIPYANSLRSPFVWDEEEIIVTNPVIKEWRLLPFIFKTDIFGGPIKAGGFYRPFYMLSFMLDYHLWGLNTMGYHLSSVILHILNALLLYVLIIRMGLRKSTAWLAALLFALFPANSGAVAPIAMRDGLILVFLSMSCILLFLKGMRGSRFYLLGSGITFALAMLTKESALVLPFIIAVYVFIFLKKEDRKKALFPLLMLTGSAFLYSGLRVFFLGNPISRTLSMINEADILQRLYTLPRIIFTAGRLIIAPFILQSEYHFVVQSFRDPYVWLGVPFLILVFALICKFLKPRKHTAFFLCWFLIGLLPYSNVLIPLHATFMGHWVYFSSMAAAALISMAIFNSREPRKIRYLVTVVLIIVMPFYVIKIVERNKEWADPFLLYQRDVEREPNSFLLHCNLGVEYFRRDMLAEAKKEFITSNSVSPGVGYDVAYNNLGVIYAREGDLRRAISCYKSAILLNNYALSYANLGQLYNNLKMHKDAAFILKEGAMLYPLNVEIRYQLGVAYYKDGQALLARKLFQEVEEMHPGYSQTRMHLKSLHSVIDGVLSF